VKTSSCRINNGRTLVGNDRWQASTSLALVYTLIGVCRFVGVPTKPLVAHDREPCVSSLNDWRRESLDQRSILIQHQHPRTQTHFRSIRPCSWSDQKLAHSSAPAVAGWLLL
jgi:hypothetical protein